MDFYENPENVDKYIRMCEDYDGSNLHDFLAKYLEKSSSLLELGCGSGNDIAALKNMYHVTGSDFSLEFIKRCKPLYPDVEFFQLDAANPQLERQFNCIFSNKVLHHLSESNLRNSLKEQLSLLHDDGLIAHSFWLGEGSEEIKGLTFNYYSKDTLKALISEFYTVTDTLEYDEFEEGDSLSQESPHKKPTYDFRLVKYSCQQICGRPAACS